MGQGVRFGDTGKVGQRRERFTLRDEQRERATLAQFLAGRRIGAEHGAGSRALTALGGDDDVEVEWGEHVERLCLLHARHVRHDVRGSEERLEREHAGDRDGDHCADHPHRAMTRLLSGGRDDEWGRTRVVGDPDSRVARVDDDTLRRFLLELRDIRSLHLARSLALLDDVLEALGLQRLDPFRQRQLVGDRCEGLTELECARTVVGRRSCRALERGRDRTKFTRHGKQSVDASRESRCDGIAGEGNGTCDEFEEREGKRIDVARRSCLPADGDLGGGVVALLQAHRLRVRRTLLAEPRQAHPTVVAEEDVGGSHVAVHPALRVHHVQGTTDVEADHERLGGAQSTAPVEELAQRATGIGLEDREHVQGPREGLGSPVDEPGDRRMVHRGQHLRLTLEGLRGIGGRQHSGVEVDEGFGSGDAHDHLDVGSLVARVIDARGRRRPRSLG